ncbi:MAG: hypothetical protein ACP5JH_02445 [Bacteroidota bacterium]
MRYWFFVFLGTLVSAAGMFAQTPSAEVKLRAILQKLDGGSSNYTEAELRSMVEDMDVLNALVTYQPATAREAEAMRQLIVVAIPLLEEENNRLSAIVKALEINPKLKEFFPQWYIEDKPLQVQILTTLNVPDQIVDDVVKNNKYKIAVVESPNNGELLEVSIGNDREMIRRIEGIRRLKNTFGGLYDKIKNRNEYAYQSKTEVLVREIPYFARISLSLLGGGVDLNVDSSIVGVKVSIDRNDLNLPFYSGGVWNITGLYKPTVDQEYKLGFTVPFNPGETPLTIIGPLQFRSRKLNGCYGITGGFTVPIITSNYIRGAFSIGTLSKRGDVPILSPSSELVKDTSTAFYYVSGNALLAYEINLAQLLGPDLSISLGGEFLQLQQAFFEPNLSTVRAANRNQTWSIFGKISYQHLTGTKYGVLLQYFNKTILTDAYINIFDWLSFEVQYSRVIFRDPKPWEHQDFIALSPKIVFTF